MGRLLKSQDYLMKCLLFVLLLGFISLGAIGGCGNNGGEQDDTQALTENDFVNDPSLSANPRGGVVVIFLEHPDSEQPGNDTGEVGRDIIPYRYDKDLNHTFCFEDENDDAEHFAVFFDSDGNEVLRVEANGECVTVFIPAGDYFLELTHDGKIEDILPVFAIPGRTAEQTVRNVDTDKGLFKSSKNLFSIILNDLHHIITPKAKAQTVADNVQTLLSSDSCVGCNLSGANLIGADLSGGNLSNADLSDANLTGAFLAQSDLCGANLSGADLCGANLSMASLDGATNLSGANLSGATWCSGCICAEDPGDVCGGCDMDIEFCV